MEIILLVVCCVILFVVGGIFLYGVSIYNGLISLRTLVEEAWSGIDVQLKKRYDLIPNLVETVKSYAKHEKGVFEKVAELRSAAMGMNADTDPKQRAEVENQLSSTLKTLFAVAENYPELKADQNFLNLQGSLQTIEDELEKSRRYYNGAVRDYNIKIGLFPGNIIANMLGFKIKTFFEITNEEERQNVKVDFSS